jgi:capsule polysaccharide export protein KpsE/RkpR
MQTEALAHTRTEPRFAAAPHSAFPKSESPGSAAPDLWLAHLGRLIESRWLLFRSVILGLIVFGALAWIIPPQYDSVVRLMPPDQENSSRALMAAMVSRAADGIGVDAGDLLGTKSSGALFIGMLRSRTIEDEIIAKFDLRKVYYVRRWDSARKKLEQYSSIAEDKKSGIITITVRDHSRERAQQMAQMYVDELNAHVNLLSVSSARREREFLEQRLELVQSDLNRAARDFSQFASANTAIDIPQQGKTMLEAAAAIQGQVIAAESELRGLQQMYGAENVRVLAVKARISELEEQLHRVGGDAAPSPDTPYPSIRRLPLLGVTYADLYRRTKIQEAVFESLTRQYELAKVEEAKEIPTVRVLDFPSYAERVAFPPRALMFLVGPIVGLASGIAWIFVRAEWGALEKSDPRRRFALRAAGLLAQDWARVRHSVVRWTDTISIGTAETGAAGIGAAKSEAQE